jgi:hypothetical protein
MAELQLAVREVIFSSSIAGPRLILLLILPAMFALTHPAVRRVGVKRFAGHSPGFNEPSPF